MTFARVRSTFRVLPFGATALVFALSACGDDDGGSPPAPEGDAGEGPSSGGKGTAGKGGSGGSSTGTAGEPTEVPAGGVGGDSSEPLAPELGWSKSFALPGINGATMSTVTSVVATGVRKLWVAGKFSQAGDILAKNVAIWNGQRWSALGKGLDSEVLQLAPTAEENMYALVRVGEQGGAPILYWDGESWTEISAEVDDEIRAIDVAPDGTLYAAGFFTTIDGVAAPGVASRAPGEDWKALPVDADVLGSNGLETVKVVGADVCVGGNLSEGSVGAACLEGGAWVSYRANLSTIGGVRSFTVADGTLYAAGNFMLEGIDTGGGVALWNGESWELVGGGLLGPFAEPDVHAVAIDGDKLYATGFVSLAGGGFVRHIAMYNGTRWNDLNGGLQKFMGVDIIESARGSALAVDDGGELYVGGRLTFAGAENAMRVARWDGADWHGVDDPLAPRLGINGFLNSVFAASDGSIYAGGGFEHLGGDALALGVARFVPTERRWYPMGAGLTDVRTLVEHDGAIYAGGDFVASGSASIKGVGRWDGAAWRSVGGGVLGRVNPLLSGPDGKLYAGGTFSAAGAVDARNVATWDGEAWSALGSIGEEWEAVRAFAFDADEQLFAGGLFTTASGAPAANVVRWEDDAWVPLGEGVDDAVDSMVFYGGKLVIAGAFSHSGAADVPHVAFWNADSEAFEAVGGGLRTDGDFDFAHVQAMVAHGKDLYVAGVFEVAGNQKVSHIARFDGKKWHDVDGGLDDVTESLSLGTDALWVGGTFTRAGGYGSIAIARYGLAR